MDVEELCPHLPLDQLTIVYEGQCALGRSWTVWLPASSIRATPYWPYSPAIGRGRTCASPAPAAFVGSPVVATEKLDGTNTLIHDGKVYARSVAAPSDAKWMAMVKKHHAWKVREPGVYLYGENIYAVHSIEYGPVAEQRDISAPSRSATSGARLRPLGISKAYAASKDIPTVPVLHRGRFATLGSRFGEFVDRCPPHSHHPSVATREGVVLRLEAGFPGSEFAKLTCAKAFGVVMCRTTSIGPGTGGPARSRPHDTAPASLGASSPEAVSTFSMVGSSVPAPPLAASWGSGRLMLGWICLGPVWRLATHPPVIAHPVEVNRDALEPSPCPIDHVARNVLLPGDDERLETQLQPILFHSVFRTRVRPSTSSPRPSQSRSRPFAGSSDR